MSFGWIILLNSLIGIVILEVASIIEDCIAVKKFGKNVIKEYESDEQSIDDLTKITGLSKPTLYTVLVMVGMILWELLLPMIIYVSWKEYEEIYELRKGS